MTPSEYLYDVSAKEFANMLYYEALKFKHQKAKELAKKLYDQEQEYINKGVHYDTFQELRQRMYKVEKAIKFNEELIKELESN